MLGLDIPLWHICGVDDVWHDHAPAHRNRTDGAQQLHRRNGNRTLSDTHGDRFAREPLLLVVADLPLFRRHDPTVRIPRSSFLPRTAFACSWGSSTPPKA